jgi:fucose permease
MRILGFIMIPLLALVVLTVRNPVVPQQTPEDGTSSDHEKENVTRKEYRKDIAKPPFILLVCGLFLSYLGFFTPFYFIPTYATHLGMSQTLSFYLVSILNGASLVGRILPGYLVSCSSVESERDISNTTTG